LRVFLFGESTTKKIKKKTKSTKEKKSKKTTNTTKHNERTRTTLNSLSLSPLFFYPQTSSKKAQLPPKPPLSER